MQVYFVSLIAGILFPLLPLVVEYEFTSGPTITAEIIYFFSVFYAWERYGRALFVRRGAMTITPKTRSGRRSYAPIAEASAPIFGLEAIECRWHIMP